MTHPVLSRIGSDEYKAPSTAVDLAFAGLASVWAWLASPGSGKSVAALSLLGLVPTPPGRIVGGRVGFRGRDLFDVVTYDRAAATIRGGTYRLYLSGPAESTLNPLFTVGEQIAETIRAHRPLSHRERWAGPATDV